MEDIEGNYPGRLASEDLQYVKEDPQARWLVGSPALSRALGTGGVCARFQGCNDRSTGGKLLFIMSPAFWQQSCKVVEVNKVGKIFPIAQSLSRRKYQVAP